MWWNTWRVFLSKEPACYCSGGRGKNGGTFGLELSWWSHWVVLQPWIQQRRFTSCPLLLHDQELSLRQLKRILASRGLKVCPTAFQHWYRYQFSWYNKNRTFVTDRLPLLSIAVIDKTYMYIHVYMYAIFQTKQKMDFHLEKNCTFEVTRNIYWMYSPTVYVSTSTFSHTWMCTIFIQNEKPSSIQFVVHF